MSINLHLVAAEGRIEVLGEFETLDDQQRLVAQIEHLSLEAPRLLLTFFDAYTLPGAVVHALAALILAGKGLKIYCYHSYLAHLMLRLSLPAIYVPQRSLAASRPRPRAVVIGGSADSLEKILYLVEHLPKSSLTLFIVQHFGEGSESHLDSLLKARTDYQVLMPTHLCPVEAATLYIAPPSYHLKVANGQAYLTRDGKVNYARPSIDVLFNSLAREYGSDLLAILLCGMGKDGVTGMQAVRDRGGLCLLEESSECSATLLTDQARDGGAYDYIFGIREITSYLASGLLEGESALSEPMIELFLEAINFRYGYDYRGYQYGTVRRRIEKLMKLLELNSFHDFQHQVLTDPGIFQRFYLEMSVEMTSFFRHPEQFKRLRDEILPYLDSFPRIKIWSAGCASGEEVYSLAMLLDEVGLLEKSQIFATDINRFAVTQARSGLFPLHQLAVDRDNYRMSGGKRSFDDHVENNGLYLKMPEHYLKHLLFYQHSLAHDGVFNEFQLILCRNVLIYFKPQQQKQVMERFARSLHPDGYLVLGKSEGLSTGQGERYFEAFDRDGRIYRFK